MEKNGQNENSYREFPPIDKTIVEGSDSASYLLPISQNETLSPKTHPTGENGEKIGNGTVVCRLGQGGMASIYKIWCDNLEIFRVVKILLPSISESSYQRFQTEARITAKLHHQNIVEIQTVDEWNGLPFIEMEFLDGCDLKKQIMNHCRFPVPVCVAIGILVCRALEYAHDQDFQLYGKQYHGIIHRDLKPENIMITNSGLVKLMDFGIARPTEVSLHTIDGNITGTLPYLSPEQMSGEDIDGRTDIYSFGAILYEMLTGEMLYPQQEITQLLQAKSNGEYKEIGDFNFNCPKSVNKLVRKCLEMDRSKRFCNAGELLAALEKIHSVLSSTTPEKTVKAFITDPNMQDEHNSSKSRFPFKKYLLPSVIATSIIALLTMLIFYFVRTTPSLPDKPSVIASKPVLTDDQYFKEPGQRPDSSSIAVSQPTVKEPSKPILTAAVTEPVKPPPPSRSPKVDVTSRTIQTRNAPVNVPKIPTAASIENALAHGNFEAAARGLAAMKLSQKSEIMLAIRATRDDKQGFISCKDSEAFRRCCL